MSATALCCKHPSRFDSPVPPARPHNTIDGIFAVAALAEDHPHAFRFLHRKASPIDASILCSPKLADKIKLKLTRKSTKSLRQALMQVVYDDDAQAMTSTEVVQYLRENSVTAPASPSCNAVNGHFGRSGSVSHDAHDVAFQVQDGLTEEMVLRSPALRSFEWLGEILQR